MTSKQLAARAERYHRDAWAAGYTSQDLITDTVTTALVRDGYDETTARKAAQAAWDNATAKPPL